MARIQYPDPSARRAAPEPLLESIRRGRPYIPNVYKMLLWSPEVTEGWAALANAVRFEGGLDARSRELAILLVSHLTGCEYEWVHHSRLASAAGVSAEEAEAVRAWPRREAWNRADEALLSVVGAIVERRSLPPEFDELRSRLGERGIVELTALVAYYLALSHFLLALEIDLEPAAAGVDDE